MSCCCCKSSVVVSLPVSQCGGLNSYVSKIVVCVCVSMYRERGDNGREVSRRRVNETRKKMNGR